MRTPSARAKREEGLKSLIVATTKLWRSYHLTCNQARYVAIEVCHTLALERPKIRKRVMARLSREEERRLIAHAYRMADPEESTPEMIKASYQRALGG